MAGKATKLDPKSVDTNPKLQVESESKKRKRVLPADSKTDEKPKKVNKATSDAKLKLAKPSASKAPATTRSKAAPRTSVRTANAVAAKAKSASDVVAKAILAAKKSSEAKVKAKLSAKGKPAEKSKASLVATKKLKKVSTTKTKTGKSTAQEKAKARVPLKEKKEPKLEKDNKLDRKIITKPRPKSNAEPKAKKIPVVKPKPAPKPKKKGLNGASKPATESGKVFVFGNGDCGQLGLGEDMIERKKPFPVPTLAELEIIDIASGGLHNIALSKDGKVYSWGCNDQKALGRAGEEFEAHPVVGVDDIKFVKIACGDSVSLALTADGYVYAWGTYRNAEGIMGYNKDINIQDTPKLIEELQKELIVDISAGVDHVLALTTNGHVYGWGNGQQYQLGRRIFERRKMDSLTPGKLSLKNIVAIGTGAYHSFAADSEGTLFTWGLNNFGQCGLNPQDGGEDSIITVPTEVGALKGQKIIKMSGGEHHSIVMNSDGQLFAFGRSDSHQTGVPKSTIEQLSNESSSQTENNKNQNKTNEKESNIDSESSGNKTKLPVPTLIPNIPKVVDYSCGSNHNLAITNDNKLYSWGYGEMLQCGNGEEEDVVIPSIVTGQKIENCQLIKVSGGGQHSVLLAH